MQSHPLPDCFPGHFASKTKQSAIGSRSCKPWKKQKPLIPWQAHPQRDFLKFNKFIGFHFISPQLQHGFWRHAPQQTHTVISQWWPKHEVYQYIVLLRHFQCPSRTTKKRQFQTTHRETLKSIEKPQSRPQNTDSQISLWWLQKDDTARYAVLHLPDLSSQPDSFQPDYFDELAPCTFHHVAVLFHRPLRKMQPIQSHMPAQAPRPISP